MGKSRFGLEAVKYVSQVLKERGHSPKCIRILIDFNGGGDQLVPELDVNPQVSLGIRILAEGYFGCSTEVFRRYVLPEEEKFCNLNDVMALIGRMLRNSADDTSLVCVYLHLDEFQLAHEKIHSRYPDFVKEMIYEIGKFKVRNANQIKSYAKENNIFLVPLLTGTGCSKSLHCTGRFIAYFFRNDSLWNEHRVN